MGFQDPGTQVSQERRVFTQGILKRQGPKVAWPVTTHTNVTRMAPTQHTLTITQTHMYSITHISHTITLTDTYSRRYTHRLTHSHTHHPLTHTPMQALTCWPVEKS